MLRAVLVARDATHVLIEHDGNKTELYRTNGKSQGLFQHILH